jgi:hypothetical protein
MTFLALSSLTIGGKLKLIDWERAIDFLVKVWSSKALDMSPSSYAY